MLLLLLLVLLLSAAAASRGRTSLKPHAVAVGLHVLPPPGQQQQRAAAAAGSEAGELPRPAVLELPVAWLQGITLVDTPGTNAVIAQHTQITDAIIPKCDLVLFCTSVREVAAAHREEQ